MATGHWTTNRPTAPVIIPAYADDTYADDGTDREPVRFHPPDNERTWPPVAKWDRRLWKAWITQRYTDWTPAQIDQYLDVDRYKYGLGLQRHPSEPYTYFYLPTPMGVQLHASKVPNVCFAGAVGATKALALDTVVPTPRGLRVFGELTLGDELFDEAGQVCRVTWQSPVVIDPKGTYRLTFDDSSEIVAGADHEWLTVTYAERMARHRHSAAYRAHRRATRRYPPRTGKRPDLIEWNRTRALRDQSQPVPGGIRTSEQIAATLFARGDRQITHAVELSAAWEMPERALPLDPYVLGVWLGDGHSHAGLITTADPEILYELDQRGWPSHRSSGLYAHQVENLTAKLKTLGLLRNKHVPLAYLTASTPQRLALLQGLMDTDGMCTPDGESSFSNTRKPLAEAVFWLAASLGLKPHLKQYDAKLYGRFISLVYLVSWTATLPVFRLPRKRDHLPRTTRTTQRYRYIVTCERVDDVPVRCIEVDSPSHLFLVGKAGIPTHNSWSTRFDAYRHLLAIPDYNSIIMRRTHEELKRNHTNPAGKDCAAINDFFQQDVMNLVPSEHELRFPLTRGLLTFGHCQNPGDEEKYLGPEYDEFRPDEMATFEKQQIIGVAGRLRSVKHGEWGKLTARLIGTTNPGPSWIKQWFIDRNVPKHENPRYQPDDYQFIPARLYDNPYLMDEDGSYTTYENRLFAYSPQRRKQLLDGNWDAVTGQFFPEWQKDLHVATLEVPRGCKIECAIDWGYSPNPGVCLWIANLPNGRLYVFAEWVFNGEGKPLMVAAKVAARIAELTRDILKQTHTRWNKTVGDPSMWAKDGHTGESYEETFRRNGVRMVRGDNDRVQGWGRLRHWLTRHPEGGAWLSFSPDCAYSIRTIPTLVHDKNDPDDCDSDGEDHAGDSIRYAVQARPSPTKYVYRPAPSIPDSIAAEIAALNTSKIRPFGKLA